MLDYAKEISKFDLKTVEIDEIEQAFSPIILGHTRPTMDINTSFFRARIITETKEEDLEFAKCIYYPDWQEIKSECHKFGRCSDKGQNFFYSSNYLGATIKELDPKNDDLVMVGIFEFKNENIKIPCQFAGIESLKRNSHRDSLIKDYKYERESDILIEEYMASKFQEKVLLENDFKYKVTIALTNILLKNENIGCLIYPSVASNLEYANYGIKPKYVDDFLYCKSVYIYRVIKSEIEYELVPERFGFRIFNDWNNLKFSRIEWKKNNDDNKQKTLRYLL
jgi:hypothetical protein